MSLERWWIQLSLPAGSTQLLAGAQRERNNNTELMNQPQNLKNGRKKQTVARRLFPPAAGKPQPATGNKGVIFENRRKNDFTHIKLLIAARESNVSNE